MYATDVTFLVSCIPGALNIISINISIKNMSTLRRFR